MTLSIIKVRGGWTGCIPELDVLYDQPKQEENYNRHEMEGITIYVEKNIKAIKDTITISVKQVMFFMKAADVKGVILRP